MANAKSYVAVDNDKHRVVVVADGRTVTVHATKYGTRETTLVSAMMPEFDAYELGVWLVENIKR